MGAQGCRLSTMKEIVEGEAKEEWSAVGWSPVEQAERRSGTYCHQMSTRYADKGWERWIQGGAVSGRPTTGRWSSRLSCRGAATGYGLWQKKIREGERDLGLIG